METITQKEVTMLSDLAYVNIDRRHTYRLQLQGALNSPSIDWCGEVFVIPQENAGILMVSLMMDRADLCNLLDQFRNLNLTILPIDKDIQNSDPQNQDSLDISPWITTGASMPDQPQIDSKED